MDPDTEERRQRDALRAAQLYYLQDQTMESIARELGTSRSSVSRLLSFARDTGVVEITVRSPHARGERLERAIAERFGVAPLVVPVPLGVSDVDRLERVAMTAARTLGNFIDSHMTVGIAWGSTMSAMSRHVIPKVVDNVTVVQMNGAGNTQTTGIDYASRILQRFGDAYGAQVQQFAVPAFFDDPATKRALWRERSVVRLLRVQGAMDVAVFGLGAPFAETRSHVYIGGYLEPAEYESLRCDEVVGDLATVFFRADGSSSGIALNERASGPELAHIRQVARRVCVVSGAQKLATLRGALAGGLVTDLVLDEALATALVASA